MFDILTPAERLELAHKLSDWGHKSAEIGHVLAKVSLADGDFADPIVWDQSERHYAIMDELYDLRAEVLAA